MRGKRGFTLIELLVVISIIALLIGILLPALGSARRTARQMQNSTHVRGIHSGCVLFAQGNKDYFPGLDNKGAQLVGAEANVSAGAGTYGYGGTDSREVAWRMARLLRGNFFSPEYMRSPAETNPAVVSPPVSTNFTDGTVYSFAMLDIFDDAALRRSEWRATNNSRAAIICDRNIGTAATGINAASIHTSIGEGWRGSVGYNDNHAVFETTDTLKTEYALKGEISPDQLFAAGDAPAAAPSVTTADAAMVFKGASSTYVSQQP